MSAMQPIVYGDPATHTLERTAENLARLQALFPEIVSEDGVDVAVLNQLIGKSADAGEEKYGLNWHGKRQARQLALTPSTGTLRPCPQESVAWESTQNLFIEGDNLEVLKLLQKSYAGKVKLIYIDPPYNTGKDFVYPDDFRDNIRNYQSLTGQREGGRAISSNTEASGRFHTDWLNMIYPRLHLARNLLQEDGVIFISIDDGEAANLRRVCDEIFGEENFVSAFVWNSSTAGGIRPKHVSQCHEYALMYAKSKEALDELYAPLSPEAVQQYGKSDGQGAYREKDFAWRSRSDNANQKYAIEAPDGSLLLPGPGYLYRFVRESFEQAQRDDLVVFKETSTSPLVNPDGSRARYNIYIKKYLGVGEGAPASVPPRSLVGLSSRGSEEIKTIFDGELVFTNPKSTDYLSYLFAIGLGDADSPLILDFFAGSGSTAHAVMAQNAADGGNRRYILVQLPEPLDPANKEQKIAADFCDQLGRPRTIAELTKERLRRAGQKIVSQLRAETQKRVQATLQPDLLSASTPAPLTGETEFFDAGFRVFRLDSSNIRAWEPDPGNLEMTLFDHVEHIKPDRGEVDILYEVLLKFGLDLCVPIAERKIAGKRVHSIGGGVLLTCLGEKIERDEVETLGLGINAWHKELAPAGDTTCIFRDSAFADDVAKTNLSAILQQHGIANVRSL